MAIKMKELIKEETRPKSVKDVNNFLKKKGVKEKLYKGKGYYYFSGGDASNWYQSAVYTSHIGDLSLDSWYKEWKDLSSA